MDSQPKRILMTGAGSRLGQVLVPQLIEAGHDVLALDRREVDYPCRTVRASVCDGEAVDRAVREQDLIIHAAALHFTEPRHRWPDQPHVFEEYWQTNVYSTHACFRSAQAHGVPKVILISSVAYYEAGPGYVTEQFPHKHPADHYYDLSKILSEDIARMYAGNFGVAAVALRPGNFTGQPEPGFPFLEGRLRREDVAQAVRQAVDYEPPDGFDAFSILAGNPFGPDDLPELSGDPMVVLERYYPGLTDHLRRRGITWEGTDRVYSIRKARDVLGYEPQYTFERYLETIGYAPS